MDARQLLRALCEHGPEAREALVAEIAEIDGRREGLVQWLTALDDAMRPAVRMIPRAGVMGKEEVT